MKILLIGHSIVDHIIEAGKEIIKPGGIFYSVLGMNSQKKNEDKIFLLTGWNKNSFHLFEKIFGGTEIIYSSAVDEMPEVFLKIYNDKEREENYKNLSSGLLIDKIKDWNQFDGILINMITGFDITLEQLQQIRKNYKGTIYFDLHTLSRGVDENMKREFRPVPKIEEWLANIDILQCNKNELLTIVENNDEKSSAQFVLSCGVKNLIVTKGAEGAVVYFKKENDVRKFFVDGEKVNTVNTIGCGDIFGAVFFYSYLCRGNLFDSLKLANHIAGIAVSNNIVKNPEVLKSNAD